MKLDHLERELDPPAAAAPARAARATRARRRVPAGDQGRGRRLPDDGDRRPPATRSRPSGSARTTASRSCRASGLEDVRTGFDGDPVPEQSRVVAARAGGVDVVCVYVVNGKEVGDPAYETKLAWLEALRAWLDATRDPAEPLIVAGDFNIAPDDRDVWDADAVARARTSRATPSASACARLLDWGLTDLGRAAAGDVQGPFAYWDYTAGRVPQGVGAADRPRARRPRRSRSGCEAVVVDRDERKPTSGEGKPSDHAPVDRDPRDDRPARRRRRGSRSHREEVVVADVRWAPRAAPRRPSGRSTPGTSPARCSSTSIATSPARRSRRAGPASAADARGVRANAGACGDRRRGSRWSPTTTSAARYAARLWWMLEATGRRVRSARRWPRRVAGSARDAAPVATTCRREVAARPVVVGAARRRRRRAATRSVPARDRDRRAARRALPRRDRAVRPGGGPHPRSPVGAAGPRTSTSGGSFRSPVGAPRAVRRDRRA